jgi:hypothetical protein
MVCTTAQANFDQAASIVCRDLQSTPCLGVQVAALTRVMRIQNRQEEDVRMRRIVIATATSLCVCALPAIASADMLTLRDGSRVSGTVMGVSDRIVTFEDSNGISHRYSTNQVESLEFTANTRRNDDVAVRDDRRPRDDRRQRTLPSGTELAVRTSEVIDSTTARANQTFSAVVENDIIGDSNDVVLPEGAGAVGGRSYAVSTTDLIENSGTGVGKNRRTAETVGGGAALGTIIGAIAGGAKGAAIGVLIGGAGGAGVEVLNRGRDVRVPAETLLNFRLDRPVTLSPQAGR